MGNNKTAEWMQKKKLWKAITACIANSKMFTIENSKAPASREYKVDLPMLRFMAPGERQLTVPIIIILFSSNSLQIEGK